MTELPTITAFSWVPDFAKGQVRDIIARWAFAELGLDYRTELLNAASARGEEYVEWHPFDQVPAYRDEEVEMFESGAILIHLGERHGHILPQEPPARAKVLSWTAAILNTVEPALRPVSLLPLFHGGKPWTEEAVAALRPLAEQRLKRVSAALGENDWIAGDFSIADILLVFVLRSFGGDMIAAHPNLVNYMERAMARPAFEEALAKHLADFTTEPA